MMLSNAGERGAVNILFLVFVLVIALAFGGLWFTQLQENEKLQSERDLATAQLELEVLKLDWAKTWYSEISSLIGVVPENIPVPENPRDVTPSSSTEGLITQVRTVIREVGPQVGDDAALSTATLVDVIKVPIAAYNTLKQKVAALEGTVASQKAQLESKDTEVAQLQSAHVAAMTSANEQAEANESRLNAQLERLVADNDENASQLRAQQDQNESQRREHEEERRVLTTKTRELDGEVKGFKSEREFQYQQQGPDGKILATDARTGIVFIDRTSGDQLHSGTRFQVYGTGKGGDKLVKGYITVINTGTTMSEARIDTLRPGMRIESGDQIINPVFNKDRAVRFVFLGQLPGRYTREMAETILREQGAAVDPAVTVNADFLVLGENESEEDLPLEEDDSYRNAKRWGIRIITAKDLAPFLRQ